MNYLGKVHPVFYCVLSFAIGVVFALLEMTDLIFLIIVMGFSSLILYYLRKTPKIFLYGAFLLIGFVRSDMWIEEFGSAQRDAVDFQFLGYISAEPDVREFNTRLVVSINNSHERVLITLPHYPEYSYGDYMYVSGELELPSVFETDSGRMFHYDTFLKKDKIYYTMKYPEINLLSSGTHGNKLTKALLDFKRVLISQIELSLPEPHSSLLAGLLVGAKSSMGDELLDDFRKTGVIHIVVLSGFNVTIIAEAIMRMLAFLGVVGSGIFGSVAILFFTIMTGASATVVRASLMAFLVILARLTGYQSHIVRSLFVAGFCMVLHNPSMDEWGGFFGFSCGEYSCFMGCADNNVIWFYYDLCFGVLNDTCGSAYWYLMGTSRVRTNDCWLVWRSPFCINRDTRALFIRFIAYLYVVYGRMVV